MAAPITAKAWSVSPNNRLAYPGTLAGVLGWWAYTNKARLLAANWTLKWSCDGTTGPVDANDATDRIPSAAEFATRATVAAAAQSWFLVENPDGVQMLFTYQGASDSIARVSYSAEGLFALAGTTTHQPTATDEIVIHGAKTIVGTSTGEDRILHIWTADDGSAWRSVVFGTSTIRSAIVLEETTRIAPASTFPVPYVGGTFDRLDRQINQSDMYGTGPFQHGGNTMQAIGSANSWGFFGSVFTVGVTRANRMVAQPFVATQTSGPLSTPTYGNMAASFMISTYCASMGGSGALCWPLHLLGERTVNLDGMWCTLIDWHQVITTSSTNPGTSDSMPGFEVGDVPGVSGGHTGVGDPRTNWFVALGAGALWPWRNAAASMEIV